MEPARPTLSCKAEIETAPYTHLSAEKYPNRLSSTLAAKDVERAVREIEDVVSDKAAKYKQSNITIGKRLNHNDTIAKNITANYLF